MYCTKYAYIPTILAIFFSALPSFSMGLRTLLLLFYFQLPPTKKKKKKKKEKNGLIYKKKNCLELLEALKRMLLVKRSSGGEKTVHYLPQIMQAKGKLGLDLDTHSLHATNALRTLLVWSLRKTTLTYMYLGLVVHAINTL